jgi:hypothetical protein
MNLIRQIYHPAKADFLERVRRFSFLAVLAITMFAGYMFVPPYGSSYTSFVIASHRGFYNSPWIGTLFGATVSTMLTLIGFYLVKNTISNDYRTRVGQIVATTPIGMIPYMLGKWLSNLLILSSILVVLMIIAPVMQISRGEVTDINLFATWIPLWIMGFPALAFIAALAVLFESIPLLRGGFGNIAYFFFWGPILIGMNVRNFASQGMPVHTFDFTGMTRVIMDFREKLAAAGINDQKGIHGILGPTDGFSITRFMWHGLPISTDMILERLVWIGLAIIVVIIAAALFNRFDPARNPILGRGSSRSTPDIKSHNEENPILAIPRISTANLTVVARNKESSPFFSLVKAELLLLSKGHSYWWYLGVIGLIGATPFIPGEKLAQYLYAAASILPILLWSAMGNREAYYRTQPIIFSGAYPIRRQFPAAWLAGVLVALIMASGYFIRMIIIGNWANLYAIIIGAFFVPTLALACGVWTNGRRMFEIIYLIIWYISIQEGAEALDYRGAMSAAVSSGIPLVYLVLTVILILLAFWGRKRQMQYQFG